MDKHDLLAVYEGKAVMIKKKLAGKDSVMLRVIRTNPNQIIQFECILDSGNALRSDDDFVVTISRKNNVGSRKCDPQGKQQSLSTR